MMKMSVKIIFYSFCLVFWRASWMFFCGILCLQFTLMFFKSGSENVLRKFSIAFTSIMFSSHALAVERLRWGERYRAPVPREWRLCRFCRAHVEDEAHTLIECRGDSMMHNLHPVREAVRSDIRKISIKLSGLSRLSSQISLLSHSSGLFFA